MSDSLETHCLYCSERFDTNKRTPKILHDTGTARKHISCKSCLKKILREKKQLVCPECNTVVDRSIEELQTCPTEDDITHAKQIVDSTTNCRCSNCDDPAHFRCEECRLYFCQDCKPGHIKNKSFRHHNVRDLTSLTKEEMENFQAVSLCGEKGHGLPIDRYCPKCEVPCCLRCEEHSKHGYVKLVTIIKTKAETAAKEGNAVLRKKNEISSPIQRLEAAIATIEEKTVSEEDNIKSTVRGITQSIELQGKELLQDLHKHNSDVTNRLESEVRKRKDLLCTMNEIEHFLKQEKHLGDIQQLEVYRNIEMCSTKLKETTLNTDIDVRQEAAKFVANNDLDFKRFKIGFVQHTHAQEDDRASLKGYVGPESIESDVRILIIGKKRSGRTTTSFALMEHEIRPSSRLFVKNHKSKIFKLRRSPGIGDKWDHDKEKADIFEHLAPGPHVLLLTIKNPDDDVDLIKDYRDVFKDDFMKFVIIVFTGKKDLDKRNVTVEKYVQSKRESEFGRILNSVGGRYVAINADNKDSLGAFRESVFKMASEVMDANKQRFLSLR